MSKTKLRYMTVTGLTAALFCVLSPISIPIGDVPVSLATVVICIFAGVLGSWKSAAVVLVYLILGCVGLPVFSGFTAGFGRIFGPTGGFLLGYIPLALIVGIGGRKTNPWRNATFMTLGTAVLYFMGTVWYCVYTDVPIGVALAVCVLPFLPIDAVKIAVAAVIVRKLGNGKSLFGENLTE